MTPATTRPLNVLQVDPCQGATVRRYRVGNLAEQLRLAGDAVTAWTDDDLRREVERGDIDATVAHYDLLILHRFPWCTAVERLLQAARTAGIRTAFEADDLVFVPGVGRWVDGLRHLDPGELKLYDEGLQRYAASDAACDTFIGATSFLAGLRAGPPRPSVVIPNLLGEEQVAVAERLHRKGRSRAHGAGGGAAHEVVIAYGSGTRTHDADLAAIAPALAQVLTAHVGARLMLVGLVDLPEALRPYADRVRLEPVGPWEHWWELLAACDIAVAPLEERNPYCRAKSALKYLEAGALGVPLVASRIDAYEQVIDDGRTGLLASGTDEWAQAVSRLVEDTDLRGHMGRRARKDVLRRHTTKARFAETHATLRALVDGKVEARQRPEGWRGFDLATVIPPATVGSGGHTVIFRTVRSMIERGHRTTVLHEFDGRGFTHEQVEGFIDAAFFPTGATYRSGWELDPARFDAVMATAWNTAEWVAGLDVPARLYFVQDLEHLFFPASENHVMAERTYALGLSCITIGRWLTEVLRHQYGADSVDFPFLLHVDRPRPTRAVSDDRPTVTYFAQPGKLRRAYEMGVAALARLHAAHPAVRIVFFGSAAVDPNAVPFPFEDAGVVSEAELEELYLRSDVGLVISLTNPSAVPPNMMRCGCAVVDVDLENNRFEYRDGVDSLLAPPTTDGLAQALIRVVADADLRRTLQAGAVASIAPRSEPRSMDLIEAALVRSIVAGRARAPERLDLHERGGNAHVSLEQGPAVARFEARHDGLCAVSFFLGTFGRTPSDLALSLRRSSDETVVARVILPGSTVGDNEWARFDFEALPHSAGEGFSCELSMMPGADAPVAVYRSATDGTGRVRCTVGGFASGPFRMSVHADPDAFPHTGTEGAARRTSTTRRLAAASRALPDSASPGESGTSGRSTGDPAGSASGGEPPRAAVRVAELLRNRHQRDVQARRRTDDRVGSALGQMDGRLGRVETSLRSVSTTLQRARTWLARPGLRRVLTFLRILPPEESWIEPTRFVTPELRSGTMASQRFVAERDGLDRLSIRFATEGRMPSNDVRLRLLDGHSGELLRQVNIPAGEIDDNLYAAAAFPPLPDSARKTYLFELTSPDGLRGCGAKIWGDRHGPKDGPGRKRLQDGHRAPGCLDFRLDYAGSVAPDESSNGRANGSAGRA